jgi:uncharacterized protein DUF2490
MPVDYELLAHQAKYSIRYSTYLTSKLIKMHLPAPFKKLTVTLLLFLSSQSAQSDNLINDSGLWTQIDSNINLGIIDPKLNKWRLISTGEARFFDDFSRYGQGIIRVMPGYQLTDQISLFFGYTWFANTLKNHTSLYEHDINQAFNWASPTDWGKLATRTMLEYRFVQHDSQMAMRLRQRVRANYQLPAIHPHLSLVGWEEVFINLYSVDWGPKSGLDQNRAFVGLNWQFDQASHYHMEVGYLNQYIHRSYKDDLIDHMLLTSLQIRF